MAQQLLVGQGLLIIEASRSLSLSFIHMTLGSISLDEWSARCSDVYLTTHNTHKRQNFRMPATEPRLWPRGHWVWQLYILVYTDCWWGSLRERGHWGDQDVDGRIILRWIFRKLEGVVGTGWSWLRIGTGGEHLWIRWGTFGFRKCGEFLD